MIQSFSDDETERLFRYRIFPPFFRRGPSRLAQTDSTQQRPRSSGIWPYRLAIAWKRSRAAGADFTLSASTTNGGSCFAGARKLRLKSRLWITIEASGYNAIHYSYESADYSGEILLEEYLKPMGISQSAMARAIRVPPRAINEIVLGRRAITPAMSIRFGAFFGQSDDFWYGLQKECDFRAMADQKSKLTKGIRTARELVAA